MTILLLIYGGYVLVSVFQYSMQNPVLATVTGERVSLLHIKTTQPRTTRLHSTDG